jgi:hypothetical protein
MSDATLGFSSSRYDCLLPVPPEPDRLGEARGLGGDAGSGEAESVQDLTA